MLHAPCGHSRTGSSSLLLLSGDSGSAQSVPAPMQRARPPRSVLPAGDDRCGVTSPGSLSSGAISVNRGAGDSAAARLVPWPAISLDFGSPPVLEQIRIPEEDLSRADRSCVPGQRRRLVHHRLDVSAGGWRVILSVLVGRADAGIFGAFWQSAARTSD